MLSTIRLSQLLAAMALLTACMGDFEPPVLDSSLDPANGELPPVPVIGDPTASCVDGELEIRVPWSVADDPSLTGFQIYRARSLTEDPGTLVATVAGTTRSFVDGPVAGIPGLAPTTPYYYRVRALGVDGLPGLRSGAAEEVTPPCP
jgi:hypothetical protein